MKADSYWNSVFPDKLYWDQYPYKSFSQLFPKHPSVTGTFRTDAATLNELANRPPRPAYTPNESELAILRKHFPNADPSAPPWDDIKTDLLVSNIAPATIRDLTSKEVILLLDSVSQAFYARQQSDARAQMNELWKMGTAFMFKALQVKDPEINPELLTRDWRSELPFLDWTANGHLSYDINQQGEWGYHCKDGTVILPDDDRLGDYRIVARYKLNKPFSDMAKAVNEVHDFIADPNNDEPIPREILRANPGLAAWLNGENSNYAPTVADYSVLLPAFIERRRRIKEQSLAGQSDAKSPRVVTTESESWSAPMPKTEMARRITGRKNARPRDVEKFLTQYGLKHIDGNKWAVRLDGMDANTRRKLDGTE